MYRINNSIHFWYNEPMLEIFCQKKIQTKKKNFMRPKISNKSGK